MLKENLISRYCFIQAALYVCTPLSESVPDQLSYCSSALGLLQQQGTLEVLQLQLHLGMKGSSILFFRA
jgi:hypothetical protein